MEHTMITGGNGPERAVVLKLAYDDLLPIDDVKKFSKESLRLVLQKGIGESMDAYEEVNNQGGKISIVDASVSSGEIFAYAIPLVIDRPIRGAVVSLHKGDTVSKTDEELQMIALTVANLAGESRAEYISQSDILPGDTQDLTGKILMDLPYFHGSGKNIGQVLADAGVTADIAISRADGPSIVSM